MNIDLAIASAIVETEEKYNIELFTQQQMANIFANDYAVLIAERDALRDGIERLAQEAEAHRANYDKKSQVTERDVLAHNYWRGRRDEAGHFRDRLAALRGEVTK